MGYQHKILLKLGYKEASSRLWLKPVGFSCFIFNEKDNWLGCTFKTLDDKLDNWGQAIFDSSESKTKELAADFEYWLKYNEAHRSKLNIGNYQSDFSLLTEFDQEYLAGLL